jgi:chromosome segregation ATPase
MANVNVAELRASLKACLEFCREHEDRDYCRRHLPRLKRALNKFQKSRKETDRSFTEWRAEKRREKKSWKALSKTLAATQDELERIDAFGYPDERTRYWDREILEDAVRSMMEYLDEHADAIDFAEKYRDKLERQLDTAKSELDDEGNALDNYTQKVKLRSDAMGTAKEAVAEFRNTLRDELGTDHPEYQSIRWPYELSPDEGFF